ncbi:RNB domain-containing ribonuclease [Nocardioides sp. Kera G14]|uniref:RNB domain-containing ribonuclease n=1 Tax=Nocardioides sp. Kera G14 TaxID=2884264 RepID=UPI001D10A361|nr:RNB domain-containing ribonuclease [Nocardioides sp. Kera G14]UDY24887.1 RNB domain-containing ribonuclease [Nocardioides sp. Kera G14]
MPSGQVIRVSPPSALREGIAQIQGELHVTPDFPPEVEAEAVRVAADVLVLPDEDQTQIPFVTIDPADSMDLDQALHLERSDTGYVVQYAIADVHAFVAPDGAIDVESHQRGESLYGADSKIPLHPTALSEGAASLLPGQVRPALLWTSTLDETGEILSTGVRRVRVKSVAKLDYVGVQQMFDSDDPAAFDERYGDSLRLLKEIGELRLALEVKRGGISLPLPDQEIEVKGDQWRTRFRSLLPVEDWNAQLSLLTGFGAARIMLDHKVGLLRTLPPADPRDVARLRRTAKALNVDWPESQSPADFIRSLDPGDGHEAAMILASTRLLRGSAYAAFNGTLPELTEHAALASPYAHVTAPLRRLIDRYAGEICVALCAGTPVPDWVLATMDELPAIMQAAARRSSGYERAILDLVEAGMLAPRVGESFDGVVVEVSDKEPTHGTVSIQDPAVEAAVVGTTALPLGDPVTVRLAEADVLRRRVSFTLA